MPGCDLHRLREERHRQVLSLTGTSGKLGRLLRSVDAPMSNSRDARPAAGEKGSSPRAEGCGVVGARGVGGSNEDGLQRSAMVAWAGFSRSLVALGIHSLVGCMCRHAVLYVAAKARDPLRAPNRFPAPSCLLAPLCALAPSRGSSVLLSACMCLPLLVFF